MKNLFLKINQLSVPAKASIVYILANLLSRGLSIITTPIFTRIMSTEQIGIVTTFASWLSIIGVFANLSLNSGGFNVAMLEYKEHRDKYESSILTLSTMASVFFLGIYCLFDEFWDKLLGVPHPLMVLMMVSFIFAPATDFWLARQRYEYRYKGVAVVSLVSTIFAAVFSVGTVMYAKYKEMEMLSTARLYGQFSVTLIIAIIFYVLIMYKGRTFYNKTYWNFALKINLPLIVHSLAKHILDVSDRTMIAKMLGKSEVGIYGTLYNLSSLSLIAWNAINASLIPYMLEKLKKGEQKKINTIVNPLLFVYAVICIFLTLLAPEIVHILTTEEYYQAIYIMPPIAAGIFFNSLYSIFGNVLMYYKKTKNIMLATVLAAIINISLNYIFMPIFGYVVAAYTTLISYVFLAVFQYIATLRAGSPKIFNMRYIVCIAVGIMLFSILCNILYSHIIPRYIILCLTVVLMLVFRKRIISLFAIMKNK